MSTRSYQTACRSPSTKTSRNEYGRQTYRPSYAWAYSGPHRASGTGSLSGARGLYRWPWCPWGQNYRYAFRGRNLSGRGGRSGNIAHGSPFYCFEAGERCYRHRSKSRNCLRAYSRANCLCVGSSK